MSNSTGGNVWESERIAWLAQDLKYALEEVADLRATLALTKTPAGGVWFWQGEGDAPESLACPVVMSAQTVREMIALIEAGRELYRTRHTRHDDERDYADATWRSALVNYEGL